MKLLLSSSSIRGRGITINVECVKLATSVKVGKGGKYEGYCTVRFSWWANVYVDGVVIRLTALSCYPEVRPTQVRKYVGLAEMMESRLACP